MLSIGIKYCGGCNPKYDRRKFKQKLEEKFMCTFETAMEDKVYDIIIVLCGCTSACAEHYNLKFKYEKILIRSEKDYIKIVEMLSEYSNI